MATKKITIHQSAPEDVLSKIPYWQTLREEKKAWLREMYDKNGKVVYAEQIASVNHALVLLEIDIGLDKKNLAPGERATISGYINSTYNKASARTAWDRLKKIRKLHRRLGMASVQRVAHHGAPLLPGNAGVPLGELVSAVESIPQKRLLAPQETDVQIIDAFIAAEIPAALKANRQKRQELAKTELDDDAYTTIGFRGMDLTLRNAEEAGAIKTPAQKRTVIKKWVSWAMSEHNITGSIQCQPLAVPPGVKAHLGRPGADARSS